MFKKLLLLIVLLLVVVLLGKNFLIKGGAQGFVKIKSGMGLDISKFNLGLLSSKLDIENIELFNSSRFNKERMISIPKIYVSLSVPRLLGGALYIEKAQFNLEEFVIVRNEDGVLNLKDFDAFKPAEKEESKKEEVKKDKIKKKTEFFIESLELKIGKVLFKDYEGGGAPKVKTYKIGLDKKLNNVDSVSMLSNAILFEVLTKTNLANLLNIDVSGMAKMSKQALQKGAKATQKTISEGAVKAQKAVKEGREVAEQYLGEGNEKVKELEQKAQDTIKKIQEEAEKLLPTEME